MEYSRVRPKEKSPKDKQKQSMESGNDVLDRGGKALESSLRRYVWSKDPEGGRERQRKEKQQKRETRSGEHT